MNKCSGYKSNLCFSNQFYSKSNRFIKGSINSIFSMRSHRRQCILSPKKSYLAGSRVSGNSSIWLRTRTAEENTIFKVIWWCGDAWSLWEAATQITNTSNRGYFPKKKTNKKNNVIPFRFFPLLSRCKKVVSCLVVIHFRNLYWVLIFL